MKVKIDNCEFNIRACSEHPDARYYRRDGLTSTVFHCAECHKLLDTITQEEYLRRVDEMSHGTSNGFVRCDDENCDICMYGKPEPVVGTGHSLPPNDPWKHRSEGMKCKTCMWFVPKEPAKGLTYDLGRCRKHAPTMNGFPAVFVNDWCGDHKLDENKL